MSAYHSSTPAKIWPERMLSEDGCSSRYDLKDAKSWVGNLHFRHVDCQMYTHVIPVLDIFEPSGSAMSKNQSLSLCLVHVYLGLVWMISLMVSYADGDLLSIQSKGPRKLQPLRKITMTKLISRQKEQIDIWSECIFVSVIMQYPNNESHVHQQASLRQLHYPHPFMGTPNGIFVLTWHLSLPCACNYMHWAPEEVRS